MNNLSLKNSFQKFAVLMLIFFFNTLALAQEVTKTPDLKVDVTTTKTTTTEEWFTNPLYWVIGGLFVIVFIAIITRGGKKD